MGEDELLTLLKIDLQRTGADLGDEDYLRLLLRAAKQHLERQGVRDESGEDCAYLTVGTAAWMYRKRVNGEAEPEFLRRMRHDLIVAQAVGGGSDAV